MVAMLSLIVPEAVLRNVPKQSTKEFSPFYKPSLFVDELGLTSDKYVVLNDSTSQLPLKISIGPLSSQRFFLFATLEGVFLQQKGLGFDDKDIDDLRRYGTGVS